MNWEHIAEPRPLTLMQESGVTANLRGISAVSDTVVWASGANGTVVRTLDGGDHWEQASFLFMVQCLPSNTLPIANLAELACRVLGLIGQNSVVASHQCHPELFVPPSDGLYCCPAGSVELLFLCQCL